MKTELLSPVGNMEALMAGVNNGADAVYLAGKKFGARAYANNFDNDEMVKAINICHLYGLKIYVTVNTIIYEHEIYEFIDYIKFIYENGVDALIIQDIGMISLIHKLFPNLEIHSSTQMHTHNNYCVKLLKKLGVSRCVLAREMSFEDISKIDKDIETEVFIHGALCVSYSGCCLFSSLNGGRSGNRGSCVGSCRLPYKILKDNKILNKDEKYPLSTKDLWSINNLKDLLDLNISSLKIEGRMKSKEYVGYITYIYRKLIDKYYNHEEMIITDSEITNMKNLYNRAFTNGYMANDNIYNGKVPNHIGTKIGKVIKIKNNKIYIKLFENLKREDAIRFMNSNKGMIINKLYNEKGLLVNEVNANEIAAVDNKINLKEIDTVNKTISSNLLKEINNVPDKKINIMFKVTALKNNPLTITISDGTNSITKDFGIVYKAINKSTTKHEIISKLTKLGSYPFNLEKTEIILDDVFIPMTTINNAKRFMCEELIKKRTEIKRKSGFKYTPILNKIKNTKKVNFLVRNEMQLLKVLPIANTIYITDYNLYKKYKADNVYYKVPRINYENMSFENENLLISDIGALYKFQNNNLISDYTLNVCNSESVNILNKLGCKKITLSVETPINDVFKLINNFDNIEVIVYGKPELMALKDFKYKENNLLLEDRMGNKFPIINDSYTSIIHFKNINLTNYNLNTNIRYEFFNETEEEINNLLKGL